MEMMSPSSGTLAKASAQAQAELFPAVKNSTNPHLKNRHADIAALYEAIREALLKYGPSIAQMILPSDGKAHVRTMLRHESGEWLASECVLPPALSGGPQGKNRQRSASVPKQQTPRTGSSNPDPMTPAQSDTLMACLTKRHGNDRAAYLAELSGFLGREVKSSRELTKADVSEFLDAVNSGREAA